MCGGGGEVEEEGGKQAGSKETMRQTPTRMCCRRREGDLCWRERRRDESVTHTSLLALLAPSLPLPPSLTIPSLPPSLPSFLRTFAFKHHARAGPAIACWTWGGGGGAGKGRQRACMTHPRPKDSTDPRLVLLLGRPPLFLKQDGSARRRTTPQRETSHTEEEEEGWRGVRLRY